MSDNSDSRKKALIVSVLAFLLAGGGIFLFLIIQGSNDLTGAGGKGEFRYGQVARGSVSSFFKVLGFDDVESLSKGGYKERPIPDWLKEADEKARKKLEVSAAGGISSDWGRGAPSPRFSGATKVPKMAARGGSGAGGLGGGGTRSSAGVSRFGGGGESGSTRISARAASAADAPSGRGALSSLHNARALLGEGLASGSAATAKARWNSSFGAGSDSRSGGNELSYGKSGLVNLDTIKKGEIDSLKTKDQRSLKVPEPGAPEEDTGSESADSALDEDEESAADTIKKDIIQTLANAAISAFKSSPEDKSEAGEEDAMGILADDSGGIGNDAGACNLDDGPPTPLCSGALDNKLFADAKVDYKAVGSTADGKIYNVTYSGSSTGADGQTIVYNSPATALVKSDGTVDFRWGDIKSEVAAEPVK